LPRQARVSRRAHKAKINLSRKLELGLLGIVLSNMGMNRVSTKPETARKLVAWSWAIFAVTDCIIVLAIVVGVISR